MLSVVEQRRVFVIEALHFFPVDFLADEPLDRLHVLAILGHHDGEGVPGCSRAAGPADTMHVILGMLWHVEIDNVADVGNVQSARGDVGGNEHLVLPVPESLE